MLVSRNLCVPDHTTSVTTVDDSIQTVKSFIAHSFLHFLKISFFFSVSNLFEIANSRRNVCFGWEIRDESRFHSCIFVYRFDCAHRKHKILYLFRVERERKIKIKLWQLIWRTLQEYPVHCYCRTSIVMVSLICFWMGKMHANRHDASPNQLRSIRADDLTSHAQCRLNRETNRVDVQWSKSKFQDFFSSAFHEIMTSKSKNSNFFALFFTCKSE